MDKPQKYSYNKSGIHSAPMAAAAGAGKWGFIQYEP